MIPRSCANAPRRPTVPHHPCVAGSPHRAAGASARRQPGCIAAHGLPRRRGPADVGYLLRKGSDIPPLMFTPEELESLVVGTRFVRAFAGQRLAHGAQSAMLKIDAVLPAELRGRAERSRVFVPKRWYEAKSGVVDALHEA